MHEAPSRSARSIVLPIAGVLVLQLTGQSSGSRCRSLRFIALTLSVVNAGLMFLGIALFDRESILTRWK